MPKISETKRDERRSQILDAALACFSENGFHQTSMPDIVKRSGMSHGAVYLYFRSKDDLIVALAVDRHRREDVLNSVARQAGNPLESLRALVRAYAVMLADPQGEARRRVGVNGWAEALRNARVRDSVVEGVTAPIAAIATFIERAKSEGLVSDEVDADSVGRALVALFQGFTLQIAWGQAVDIEAALTVIDRMLSGLAPAQTGAARRPARRRSDELR